MVLSGRHRLSRVIVSNDSRELRWATRWCAAREEDTCRLPDLAPADRVEYKVNVNVERVEHVQRCTDADTFDSPCTQAGTHLQELSWGAGPEGPVVFRGEEHLGFRDGRRVKTDDERVNLDNDVHTNGA